ncbi:MAG: glycosyltransferase family 2 protein [Clostridia bacterium]|nr:glycosyltransferase family 2 protein [Clostridia bacterium]
MKADITVIMPVHNAEKTIKEAVLSISSQNVPCELILINDRSTDSSVETAEKALGGAEQISLRVIDTEENKGPGGARNLGILNTETKYIAFLDSDDMWREGKLEKQLSLLEKTGAALCSTAREFITAEGNPTGMCVGVKEKITYSDLLKTNSISLSSVMIKTDVMKSFLFSEDRNLHEDYVSWLKILKSNGPCLGINEALLLYRRSEGQVSGGTVNTALKHYRSLRAADINPVKSLFCFASYAVNGVLKHRGLK